MKYISIIFYAKLAIYIIHLMIDILKSTISTYQIFIYKKNEPEIVIVDSTDMNTLEILLMSIYISLTPGTYTIKANKREIIIHQISDNIDSIDTIKIRTKNLLA